MQAQIGLMIEGQDGLHWGRWKALLQTAEDCGYQCVFRSDHFTNASGEDKDSLELWASLTYAASHTSRLEFGPLVTPVTFRHPAMTVRQAAAVDDLSNGRLVLGMGAGWQEREHRKFSVPFYDFPTRFAMFTEALELTQRLWESDSPVYMNGQYFSLEEATLLPRPERKPPAPILIGGNGEKRTLPLVAQYAQEWNAVFIDRPTYRLRSQHLDGLLAERGRPANSVKRSLMTQVIYSRDEASLKAKLVRYGVSGEPSEGRVQIVGNGAAVVDQLGQWVEAGIQRFMLQWLELDNLEEIEHLAADILPHFHQA
jgi:F420-dependent oxidoreductase-like protein